MCLSIMGESMVVMLNMMVMLKLMQVVSMTSFWEEPQFSISLSVHLPKVVTKATFTV